MSPNPAAAATATPGGGGQPVGSSSEQRPPRHPRVQFIRVENANGEAPLPSPQQPSPSHSGAAANAANHAPSPYGSTAKQVVGSKVAGWATRPPYSAAGTPRGGGGGSVPGTPRSVAGTPRSLAGTPRNRSQQAAGAAAAGPAKPPNVPAHKHKYFKVILWASFLLCINAGFINAITLNSLHGLPAAHVTGMIAKVSNYAATGHGWLLTQYIVAYLSFLLGACISGMLINYETFYLGRNYGRALFMIAAMQSLALLTENVYDQSIVFNWLCCLCCGLQNGLTSKYSGNAVRTTHLTGATTDLGIAVGHILKGRSDEWWKVKLHGIAVLGFFIGGVLGVFAAQHYENFALIINVGFTALLALAHTLYLSYHERMTLVQVLESKSDIRLHKKRVKRPPPLDVAQVNAAAHTGKSPIMRPSPPYSSGIFGSFRLPSPRALLSPVTAATAARTSSNRRHFPKNDNDTGGVLLPSTLTSPSSSFEKEKDGQQGGWEAKANNVNVDLEAGVVVGKPPLPPLARSSPRMAAASKRALPRQQSLPVTIPRCSSHPLPHLPPPPVPSSSQQQQQPYKPRVLAHHDSLPRRGQREELRLAEDELEPTPEDMLPLPEYEIGDEAARASLMPSPADGAGGEEEEFEGYWAEDGLEEGCGVEGEFGYSPRCGGYDAEEGRAVEWGWEEEEDDDDDDDDDDEDPPTDDDVGPFDDLEQGQRQQGVEMVTPMMQQQQQQRQPPRWANKGKLIASLRPSAWKQKQQPPLLPKGGGGSAAVTPTAGGQRRAGAGWAGIPTLKRSGSL